MKFITAIIDSEPNTTNCGGWVATKAKTAKGLVRAFRSQVWSASNAALCGYRLKAVVIDRGLSSEQTIEVA